MSIVIQLYTDESKIVDGIFVENYLADNYYNTIVFNELDFRKYESIIRELELWQHRIIFTYKQNHPAKC